MKELPAAGRSRKEENGTLTSHICLEVNGKNVLRQVQGVGVDDLMDADGLRVMVDGNVNVTV